MRKSLLQLMALLVAVVMALAGCGGSSGADNSGSGSASSKLVIAIGGSMPSADPHQAYGFPANLPIFGMFDALTRFNEKGELEAALATEWTSINETTWRFKLRQGVKFHNGDDFKADSVKFTFDRATNPDNKLVITSRVGTVKETKIVDDYTVDVITKAPDPLLPKTLSVVMIVPAGYFQKVGDKQFALKPVGTGAFEFAEFVNGDHFTLKASDKSWRGKPKVSEVQIKIIPEASTRMSALQTGEVDIAHNLPTDKLDQLKKEGISVITANLGRTASIIVDPLKDSPLKDVRVRQAIQYAVDREALVKAVMNGLGRPADGQMTGPDGFGHNPNVTAYPYDPVKAKQLLTDAGFPNGFTVKFDTPSGININDKETAEAVAGYLLKVGIKAEVNPLEYAGFLDRVGGKNVAGRSPLMLYGPDYLPLMDGDFQLVFYQTAHPSKRYNNPEFDQLYKESTSTLDLKKREADLQKMQELLHRDAVVFPLYQIPLVLGANSKVSGLSGRSDQVIWLDTIAKN
jgi:peptide/nickel transport system substrate-binding protein